ncbi:hypothetical protein SRB5_66250 [Streptomyces sp. RB5]|uniref:Secreted protein n=1 Tax=Streptomyces smaragdinus TaxID=2585196 RepID=A0A7K0CSF2_9ACTN|nr:hypothetical protein [Streptomyces smaragdinus]MQY16426.1 hypothetical protein [Streptomyces smaragdinus]
MRHAVHLLACTVVAAAAVTAVAVASDDPGRRAPQAKGPREAACGTVIEGSTAWVSCFNPSPYADRVRLHVECANWWDPDVDSAPLRLDPAEGGRLEGRCWFAIRGAWVTHEGG